MQALPVRLTSDPELHRLVQQHPNLEIVGEHQRAPIEFRQGNWDRSVDVGFSKAPLFGLAELADNNPMVCADACSVPDAASTLAMIALGPLARAGLILEAPTLIFSFAPEAVELEHALRSIAVPDGSTVVTDPMDHGTVLACSAMAAIETSEPMEMLDELYEEAYGRSFFVRQCEPSAINPEAVAKSPFAHFSLRITVGEASSLLTVQTIADRNGKCGAAQVVHALNIMAGFEESLGIL